MLRRTLLLLGALLFIGACDTPDFTGLNELSQYAEDALDHMRVDSVVCQTTTLAVGEMAQCLAKGADGQILAHSSTTVVLWSTSDPAVLSVQLDGWLLGQSPGSAEVIARGPRGSQASLSIAVE